MSAVMSVRLYLSGVRVLKVPVDAGVPPKGRSRTDLGVAEMPA